MKKIFWNFSLKHFFFARMHNVMPKFYTSVTLVMVNYINFSSCQFIIHVFKSKEFFKGSILRNFFCTKAQPTTLENFVVVVCAFLVGNQVKLNLMRSRKSRKGTAGEFPSTILLLWLIRPNPKFCLGFSWNIKNWLWLYLGILMRKNI